MYVKVKRSTIKVFASKSGNEGIAKFNNNNDTADSYTKDVNELQNEYYEEGAKALEGVKGALSMQQLNGILYVITMQIANLAQDGIPVYAADEVYDKNSVIRSGSKLYRFLVNNPYNNVGLELNNTRYWEEVIDLADTSGFFKKSIDDNKEYMKDLILNTIKDNRHDIYNILRDIIRNDIIQEIREDNQLYNLIENKMITGQRLKERILDIIQSDNTLVTRFIADFIKTLNDDKNNEAVVTALKEIIINKGGIIEGIRDSVLKVNIASVVAFPLSPNDTPLGYLYCDGRAYKKDKYKDLYSKIGDLFRRHYSGSGSMLNDEFAVPDMRNRVIRAVGTDNNTLGAKQEDAQLDHKHYIRHSINHHIKVGKGWSEIETYDAYFESYYDTSGSNIDSSKLSNEVRMKNVALNYFIKY